MKKESRGAKKGRVITWNTRPVEESEKILSKSISLKRKDWEKIEKIATENNLTINKMVSKILSGYLKEQD